MSALSDRVERVGGVAGDLESANSDANKKSSSSSRLAMLVASFAIAVCLFGEIGSVIFLNWWLTVFPGAGGAPFAIQLSSSIIYLSVFILTVVLFFLPLFGFSTIKALIRAKGRRGLALIIWMGLTDLASNIIAVYAASHVPEILQAFIQTTVPPWALLLQYFFVRNQRSLCYKNKFLVGSIVLATIGIVGSSIPAHPNIRTEYTEDLPSFIAWVLLFASTAAIYAGWCVLQRQYCDHVPVAELVLAIREDYYERTLTSEGGRSGWVPPLLRRVLLMHATEKKDNNNDNNEEATALLLAGGENNNNTTPVLSKAEEEAEFLVGALEKTLMLLGDTFFQVLWTLAILPIDALPWFGTSPDLASTWSNLVEALRCVATCPSNFLWCALYSLSYFVSYLGDAYLNRVSPTLCCIIIQLSAPVTAVFLLLFPMWNVSAGGSAAVIWWQQALACALMMGSAVLYYLWERMEDEEHKERDARPDMMLN